MVPAALLTLPMPLISTSSALSTCHDRIDVPPGLMTAGFALKRWITTLGTSLVVTVTRARLIELWSSFTVRRKL